MKEKVMQVRPYAGNPHVAPPQCYGATSRFEEVVGAPKRSGRSALLYKFGMKRSAAALVASVFCSVCLADACSARCAEMVCDAGTVVLSNACARLTFDSAGRIVSAKENATGRELIAAPTHFVGVTAEGGAFAGAASMEMRGGLLVFAFPGGRGTVALRPAAFDGGFTFAIEDSNVASAKTICAGRVAPACRKWTGRMANMMSDEKGGVCVRPYDLFSGFGCASGILQAEIPAGKAKGARFGIVAADRDSLQRALRAMTIDSGRTHSPAGGAWALGSEATRGSYLNADVTSASFDDWMDVVERGGFEVLHFRERWYSCRGHYPVNRSDWPGGLADMKSAVGKLHAAGYKAGLHTLTGCIDPKDPWVAGPENSQLMAWETYTLAEGLAPDATSLAVNEPPRMKHDAVFTYSGNGNALRIGNEIVQYSGFSEKPPYLYTGLVRGAFGTKPAVHAKGEEVAYLQQRYIAFYPGPDSQLADQVADAIANVYNGCGFDQIYCDGTEGMMSGYGMAAMREKIISRCASGGRPCLNEDSRGIGMNPHTWWFHSRVGAWDSCYWAQKRFHDLHVEEIKGAHVRESNLMEIQMGWWGPHLGNVAHPCIKLDDMEYYASRNAGLDASMSIASINVSRRPLKFHHSRMLTVLGWYERARPARAFAPGVREAFDRRGAEFRLRQDPADGVWKVAPVEGFALGASTLVAQAQGRRDPVAAMRAGNRSVALGVALVAVLSAGILILHRPILHIFASKVGAADAAKFHSLGLVLFGLMALWQMFDAADIIISGALKGAGDTQFVMGWLLFVSFAIWLPVAWGVSRVHNTMPALWGTMVLDVVVICIGSVIRWRHGTWRRIRMV